MSCFAFFFHRNSPVSHAAIILPSLSLFFQSNANVLQPSAQQRRLRLVLRAGVLLTDVKPPGGQWAAAPLWLTDGRSDGWMETESVGEVGPVLDLYLDLDHTHTHIWRHTPTTLKAASFQRELERGAPQEPDQPCFILSLSLLSCLVHSGWSCVYSVCVCVRVRVCARVCARVCVREADTGQ